MKWGRWWFPTNRFLIAAQTRRENFKYRLIRNYTNFLLRVWAERGGGDGCCFSPLRTSVSEIDRRVILIKINVTDFTFGTGLGLEICLDCENNDQIKMKSRNKFTLLVEKILFPLSNIKGHLFWSGFRPCLFGTCRKKNGKLTFDPIVVLPPILFFTFETLFCNNFNWDASPLSFFVDQSHLVFFWGAISSFLLFLAVSYLLIAKVFFYLIAKKSNSI